MGLQPLAEGNESLPAQCITCGNVHTLKLLLLRHPGMVRVKVVPAGEDSGWAARGAVDSAANAQAEQGGGGGGGLRVAAPPFSAKGEQGAGKGGGLRVAAPPFNAQADQRGGRGGGRGSRRRRMDGREAEGQLHASEAAEAAGVERRPSELEETQEEAARSGLSRLSRSLDAWSRELQLRLQTLETQVWRWFRRVATVVRAIWAEATVEMFGSWVSRLQLSCSDVDILVCRVPPQLDPAQALKRLAEALQEHLASDVVSIKLVPFARVPVAKVSVALPSEVGSLYGTHVLVFDVSLDGAAHRGIATTRFTREACADHAALRPLVLVLKQLVSAAGLNSSEAGGLPSYALFLMATSLLQMPVAQDAGSLLLRFLHFFGAPADSSGGSCDALHAVLLDAERRLQAKLLARRELGELGAFSAADAAADRRLASGACGVALLVQDPLGSSGTVENNVATGAFNFHAVQSLLRSTLTRLERLLQEPPHSDREPASLVHALLLGQTAPEAA